MDAIDVTSWIGITLVLVGLGLLIWAACAA